MCFFILGLGLSSRSRYSWARVIASEVRESLGSYQVRAEIIAPRAFRSNGKRRTNKNLTRSRRADYPVRGSIRTRTLTATQWKEELVAGDRQAIYMTCTRIEQILKNSMTDRQIVLPTYITTPQSWVSHYLPKSSAVHHGKPRPDHGPGEHYNWLSSL